MERRRARPAGEGLCRRQRLLRRADFLRCYRKGRKCHGTLASVHFHPNEGQDARLGITASRQVGKAVVRHRLKRRVREVFRRFEGRGRLESMDIVVHLKPAAGRAEVAMLAEDVRRLLTSVALRLERQR